METGEGGPSAPHLAVLLPSLASPTSSLQSALRTRGVRASSPTWSPLLSVFKGLPGPSTPALPALSLPFPPSNPPRTRNLGKVEISSPTSRQDARFRGHGHPQWLLPTPQHYSKLLSLILSLFFFGCVAYGVFVPRPGMEPTPLQWKLGFLTTGPPGKSRSFSF